MSPSPNLIEGSDQTERDEGFQDEGDSIYLDLKKEDIVQIIGKRVTDGETWANQKLKLDDVRKQNEMRWMNQNLEVTGDSLYKHQVPYRDNRIFLSVETLVSNVVQQIPEPVITEAQDTDASRELATNYGKVLKAKAT